MKRSIFVVPDNFSSLSDDASKKNAYFLGAAAEFILYGQRHSSVKDLVVAVTNAIDENRIALVYDLVGRALAYVRWQGLDQVQMAGAIRNGAPPHCESSKGRQIWISDLIFPSHSLKPVLETLRDGVFAADHEVTYARRRAGGGQVVKRISRADKTTFIRQSNAWNKSQFARKVCIKEYVGLGDLIGAAVLAQRFQNLSVHDMLRYGRRVISSHQYRVFRGEDGRLQGFVTWAWMTEECLAELEHKHPKDMHLADLNEGTNLCIWDCVSTSDHECDIVDFIANDIFRDERRLFLYSNNEAGGSTNRLNLIERGQNASVRAWVRGLDARADVSKEQVIN